MTLYTRACPRCGGAVEFQDRELSCLNCGGLWVGKPLPLVDEHKFLMSHRTLSKTSLIAIGEHQRGEQRRVELEARRKRVLELAPNYNRQEIASALGCTPRQVELDLKGASNASL